MRYDTIYVVLSTYFIVGKAGTDMMNYLNTNAPAIHFRRTINSEIYIDKSMLINKLNMLIGTGKCYVCVTRPRRFGKTINANMLGAYYTRGIQSEALFSELEIAKRESYEKHLNQHNVIYIDFSRMPDFCESYKEYIKNIIDMLKEDLLQSYPQLQNKKYSMLSKMFQDTGDSYIFILDEWDSIFYKKFMTKDDKDSFLEFLKGLLKDQPYVELAYMTGVLPIAKYSSGSELNMFEEYNFMNDNVYDSYFGFQEEEVKGLCSKFHSVSYEELKRWYDGYYTSDGRSLFNPRSVSNALSNGLCRNYWTETGPMNEVADCIEHNVDEVREDIVKLVSGMAVPVKLKGYSASEQQLNNRDEILSAMVVYGFLSYHDGLIKIPNHELMEKFEDVMSRQSMGAVRDIVNQSREMLSATLHCDVKRVAQILEEVHDREIPFLKYHDENALSCVITLCYLYAREEYWVEREYASGKGYCDYIFIPKKTSNPAIILELKYNHSAEDAIQQIKDRNYIQKVKHCKEILLVGINYDEGKHHTCIIEKYK